MPYYDDLPDTLLIAGTDLQTITGVTITDLSGLLAPGLRRGNDDTIPARAGALRADLPLDAYSFTIPVTVSGTDWAATVNNFRALATVLYNDGYGKFQMTRRLAKVGGGYDAHTAKGRFTGFANTTIVHGTEHAIDVDIQLLNEDGCWLDSGVPDVI